MKFKAARGAVIHVNNKSYAKIEVAYNVDEHYEKLSPLNDRRVF